MKTYRLEGEPQEAEMVECVFGTWVRLEDVQHLITAKPEPSEQLPDDFRRIALLFTSRCTRTKMTSGEKRAWAAVGGTIKEHDLELLEWFYALDKSPEFDCTWRQVGMPATLLNNLDAQLDFAFEHKEAMRKSETKLGTAPQW